MRMRYAVAAFAVAMVACTAQPSLESERIAHRPNCVQTRIKQNCDKYDYYVGRVVVKRPVQQVPGPK